MKGGVELTIGQRLAFGFGLTLALLAVQVGLAIVVQGQIADLHRERADVIVARAVLYGELTNVVLRAALDLRAYGARRETTALDRFRDAQRRAHQTLDAIGRRARTADEQAEVDQLRQILAEYDQAAARYLATVDGTSSAEVDSLLVKLRTRFIDHTDALAQQERQKGKAATASIVAAYDQLRLLLFVVGTLVLLAAAVTAWRTTEAVRRPVGRLLAAARALGAGDYEPALTLRRPGSDPDGASSELTELADAFSSMAEKLRSRENRLAAEARLTAALAASLAVEDLGQNALEAILAHVGGQIGAVYLRDGEGHFRRSAAYAISGVEDAVVTGEGIVGQAARSRQTVVVRDLPNESPLRVRLGFEALPPREILAVPAAFGNETVAVILIGSVRELSDDARTFLEEAAALVALSLKNATTHAEAVRLAGELAQRNADLAAKNVELERIGAQIQAQSEEIQAQNEELHAQSEEIHAQNEELQAQAAEIRVQNQQLKSQSEELQAQNEELRSAYETIAASESRFRHIVETNLIGIGIWSEGGRLTGANDLFLSIVGRERADLEAGRLQRDALVASEWRERARQIFEQARRTGAAPRCEGDLTRPDGTRIPVLVGIARIDPSREEYVSFLVDMTERRRLEVELRQRATELAAADRRKDEFLAMLAHELRNPLGALSNAVALLRHVASDDARFTRVREVIERQVRYQARLLDDLLDTSRVLRGRIELKRERVDLGQIVRETVEDHRAELEGGGRRLELELSPQPLWVDGDSTRLAQVLGNLLSNAVKFTRAGDTVRVSTRVDDDEHQAIVAVSDTGVGIEPELLPRIFDTFAQADVSLARSRGGLGLGLTLVKALTQLHDGEVQAASAGSGRGAEFVLRLPLAALDALGSQPASVGGRDGDKRRVLIIEDNVDAAESLRELLELGGHTVEVALSGPAGLEAARRFLPNVVLCDLGLPGLDGFAVATELRNHPTTAGARLIAISGYGGPETRARTRLAGFDLHLTKPINPDDVEQILSSSDADPSGGGKFS